MNSFNALVMFFIMYKFAIFILNNIVNCQLVVLGELTRVINIQHMPSVKTSKPKFGQSKKRLHAYH